VNVDARDRFPNRAGAVVTAEAQDSPLVTQVSLFRASGLLTWALVPAFLVGAAGCAMPQTVALDTLTIRAPRKGGRGREVIVFPAVDERPDAAGCGAVRSSMTEGTALVTCEPEPKDWLAHLVLAGLNQAGFHIVTTENARSPDPLRLNLTLKQLFMDMQPQYEAEAWLLSADVQVLIQAKTATGLAAERSFVVGKKQLVTAPSPGWDDHQPVKHDASLARAYVMDEATRDLAAEIVNAIIILADRYPTIGTVKVPSAVRLARSGP
jgi:hypothetical protein